MNSFRVESSNLLWCAKLYTPKPCTTVDHYERPWHPLWQGQARWPLLRSPQAFRVQVAICDATSDGWPILWMNAACCRAFGVVPELANGRTLSAFVSEIIEARVMCADTLVMLSDTTTQGIANPSDLSPCSLGSTRSIAALRLTCTIILHVYFHFGVLRVDRTVVHQCCMHIAHSL